MSQTVKSNLYLEKKEKGLVSVQNTDTLTMWMSGTIFVTTQHAIPAFITATQAPPKLAVSSIASQG